jgi:dTDP-4-dehydrorhamnose reductase
MEAGKTRLHCIGARSLIYSDIRPLLTQRFDLSDDNTPILPSLVSPPSKKKRSTTPYLIRLNQPQKDWKLPEADFFVIWAAQTDPKICQSRPQETYLINVIKTKELIDLISKKGGRVIYPSTNLVFPGDKPFYKCSDEVNPKGEYGRQKSEVENYIMNEHKYSGHTILRMTKVWSPRAKFYLRWEKERAHGIPLKISRNRLLAPLTPQGISRALNFVTHRITSNRSEIVNISGNFSISSIALARKIYNIRNINDISFEEITEPTTSKTGLIHNSLKNCLPDWDEFSESFFYKTLKMTLPS